MVFNSNNSITHITQLIATGFLLLMHICFPFIIEDQDSKTEYIQFLKGLENDKSGLVIISDNSCKNCITASSLEFRDSLAGIASMDVHYINALSDFGRAFSMKFRVHRRPAFLLVDSKGQILKKSYQFPTGRNDFLDHMVVEDTLPPVNRPLNLDVSEYPDFYESSFRSASFRRPGQNELRQFLEESGEVTNPISWAVISRFSLEDSIISKVVDHKSDLIEKYGKQEVDAKLNAHLYEMIKKAVRTGRGSVEKITDQCYRMFDGADAKSCSIKFQSYYYQLERDWFSFVELGNELAMGEGENRDQLVSMAATLLRAGADKEKLSSALSWFQMPVNEMSLKELEVKASLSFRTGLKEEARDLAKAALKRAEDEGEQAPSATQILEEPGR